MIKRFLVNILSHSWFCPYLQKFRKRDIIFYYNYYCKKMPVNPNKVLMLSDSRSSLGGNLEFVDKRLKEKGYEVDYFLKNTLQEKKTKEEKKNLCKLMAQARFIVLDDFYPIVYALSIREGTELYQLWHAMGAFKTVGFSRIGKEGGPNPRSLSHRNYTGAIVSSEQIRKDYAEAFGIALKKVHATGIPRTDVFFDDEYKRRIRESLYEKYPELIGKKVILFAPTFRGNGQATAHYNFEWIDFDKMKRELGDQYCFIIKMHPFIHNIEHLPENDGFFLNLTMERDINDLLFITDILITDYSSVIFEGSLLDIDTVFFTPDLEEYIESRDFYYPFSEYMFGKMARNQEELLDAIRKPENDSEKRRLFKAKFCGSCDGHATERVVEKLF